jgi:hypothetical protein
VSVADSAEAAAAVAAIQTMINGVMADSLPIAQHAVEHTVALMDPFGNDISGFMADIINHSRVNLPRRDDSGPLDWSAVEDIVNDSTQGVSDVAGDIAKIVDTVETHTQSLIAGLLPDVTESIAGALRAFAELVSGLLGSLSEESDLWSTLYAIFKAGLGADKAALADWVVGTSKWIVDTVTHPTAEGDAAAQAALDNLLNSHKGEATSSDAILSTFDTYPRPLKTIIYMLVQGAAAYQELVALAAPTVMLNQQSAMRDYVPTPLVSPGACHTAEAARGRRGIRKRSRETIWPLSGAIPVTLYAHTVIPHIR